MRGGGGTPPPDPLAIEPASGDRSARAKDLSNRGLGLIREGRPQAALADLREAIRLDPCLPGARNNLGIALQVLGESHAAEAEYRAAIRLEPESYPARVNLGNLLRDQRHDYAAAAAELREALHLRPGDAALLSRMAQALEWDGRGGEAAAAYDTFAREFPAAVTSAFEFERGLLKLKLGDFGAGWPALERRHEAPSAGGLRIPGIPTWHGETLDGTLLLNTTTDGYGDALMAIRFATEARRCAREIALLCRPSEARLLGRCGGIDRIATEPAGLPPTAAQTTVLGLAAALGVTPETMHGGERYLSADDETTRRWRGMLEAAPGRLKVGVTWQGHPRHAGDARRSFRLAHLAPLAAAPGVSLVSLQKGPGCEQLAETGFPIIDLGFEYQVGDWLDTAAIISGLDLVVSPDTAVAHCAGGLGRPTWIALSYCAEWRWLLDRVDSPWYSSVRLFRQARSGDWAGVFRRMAEALAAGQRAQGGTKPR
jgi:Tetratricopeptide repeat